MTTHKAHYGLYHLLFYHHPPSNTQCTSHGSCAQCESQKRGNCFPSPHFCTRFICCLECISIPPTLTTFPSPNSKYLGQLLSFSTTDSKFPLLFWKPLQIPRKNWYLPFKHTIQRVLGVLSTKLHALRLPYFPPGELPGGEEGV